jgi:hypothetical protein
MRKRIFVSTLVVTYGHSGHGGHPGNHGLRAVGRACTLYSCPRMYTARE